MISFVNADRIFLIKSNLIYKSNLIKSFFIKIQIKMARTKQTERGKIPQNVPKIPLWRSKIPRKDAPVETRVLQGWVSKLDNILTRKFSFDFPEQKYGNTTQDQSWLLQFISQCRLHYSINPFDIIKAPEDDFGQLAYSFDFMGQSYSQQNPPQLIAQYGGYCHPNLRFLVNLAHLLKYFKQGTCNDFIDAFMYRENDQDCDIMSASSEMLLHFLKFRTQDLLQRMRFACIQELIASLAPIDVSYCKEVQGSTINQICAKLKRIKKQRNKDKIKESQSE